MAKELKGHTYQKGVYVTTMNQIENLQLCQWSKDRIAEYFWIGLIQKYLGRRSGSEFILNCFKNFRENYGYSNDGVSMSEILSWDEEKQENFYKLLSCNEKVLTALDNLCIYFTDEKSLLFNRYFLKTNSIEKKIETTNELLEKIYDHQSFESTDIRYVVIGDFVMQGRLHLNDGMTLEAIKNYLYCEHDDECMRAYRPLIRSLEITCGNLNKEKFAFYIGFWEKNSQYTDCKFLIKKDENISMYKEMGNDFKKHMLNAVIYYNQILTLEGVQDNKKLVLFGLFDSSLRRFNELVNHDLFCEISGRNILRGLYESYVMSKILLKNESYNKNIYDEYILYGLGAFKKIATICDEEKIIDTHLDSKMMHALVSDYKDEMYVNIDTRYFKKGFRENCTEIGEPNLYNSYDYDSCYEHVLWGSVEESTLLKCLNPGHRYHWSLGAGQYNDLPSVLEECIKILQKHTNLLHSEFNLPKEYSDAICNFKIKENK